MTYRQTPIKGEGQIVSEYRQLSLKEQLEEARERIKAQQEQIHDLRNEAARYRRMRQLEVVIMAEDGAKYLKGAELDEYLDALPYARQGTMRAQMLKELTPALNNIFGEEYAKYQEEHGALIDSHLNAMEAIHDKT